MTFLRKAALVAAWMPAAAWAQAEAPPSASEPTATISVKSRVVAVTALVRDKNGALVRSLDKDAFSIKDEGKEQKIRYFDKDNDLPLRIGLMVDTSGSQKQYFAEQEKAGDKFLARMLSREQDKAFVVQFDTDVLLLQPMTPDIARLENALSQLGKHVPDPKKASKGTLLYDAMYATAEQVAGKEQGRRAVVVLTDGEDNGSTVSMSQAITQVQKADVAVYVAIYTDHDTQRGLYVNPALLAPAQQKLSGRMVMEHLAVESGGRLFVVARDMPIEKVFEEVERDMRSQYRMGFVPQATHPGMVHTLQVKVKDPKLAVQARTGYFAPKD